MARARELLREVIAQLQSKAEFKQIKIVIDVDPQ
jgi:hypothetical protein